MRCIIDKYIIGGRNEMAIQRGRGIEGGERGPDISSSNR